MDKFAFCTILECALLNFDGVTKEELVEKYTLNERFAIVGIKLYEYLKSIKV